MNAYAKRDKMVRQLESDLDNLRKMHETACVSGDTKSEARYEAMAREKGAKLIQLRKAVL
jgi:hypothetical protein